MAVEQACSTTHVRNAGNFDKNLVCTRATWNSVHKM